LPESGNSIIVQHDSNIISIYRNLSGAIVTKGQRVAASEILGYSAVEEQSEKMFEFEMWMGGKPLNPESYILF
jgi:murein DD-endopeptidase MepM/ murein hydrolase activator NlpD